MKPNWFIGYPVAAGDWLEPLLESAPEGLTRFVPEDLHVTLAFLGGVGEQAALEGWSVITRRPPKRRAISFASLEPFGKRTKPSAFSLTLDHNRGTVTSDIRALRDDAIAAADARPETRKPRPHVTIARPGRRASAELLTEGLAWCERAVAPEVELELERVALYTWASERGERLFRVVEELELAP